MFNTALLRPLGLVLASGAVVFACASSGTTSAPRANTVASSHVRHNGDCNDWEIYFATNSAEVSPETRTALGGLAQCIRNGDVREVTVLGSADPRGSSRANGDLAQRRADAIREILVAYGCPPSVVGASSVGERGASGSPNTYAGERRALIHAHDVTAD
jgi:outer membrane protein OmpA-like peptidoglycan-associated protein